ncbi:hypothetical protein [Micromonospora sp. KC723]|uniref:hypothetical protein n=1 Tax=Micromonospora sp. KC723 TaxID=2530381 RepID=UPI00104FFB8C|nr:hypothetical protein [Micromonospora sp. KC723]TDB73813.1 hypothetical protein E1165_16265 [Micromonospora sp. KC723]
MRRTGESGKDVGALLAVAVLAVRGRPQPKRHGPVRQLRLSDHAVRHALSIVEAPDVLDVEMGQWLAGAGMVGR